MQLHSGRMAWEGLDPDPINIKKKLQTPVTFYKGQFFAVFCYFSPCARIMRGKTPLNYYFLVGKLLLFGG